MAVVGAVRTLYRTGDHFSPAQSFPNNLWWLNRYSYRSGTAGEYYTSSHVSHVSNCWWVGSGSTGLIGAVGAKMWEGGFCETSECQCSHTEHTWKTNAVGGVSGTINFNFDNCNPLSSGGASAVSAASLIFTGGIEASFDASVSGSEGTTDVTMSLTTEGVVEGEVSTTIGDDAWNGLFAASVNERGKFIEGCGFDGYMFEAGANISSNAAVSAGAQSADADSSSWIGSDAGLLIAKKAGQDGCMNPLDPSGREGHGRVRLLWDGTPVTEYLQMIAALDLDVETKLELIYMAECTGGEIDYYLNLISAEEIEDTFGIIDREAVGIPENDIERLEWIR